jgi:Uma2 family endonuclease
MTAATAEALLTAEEYLLLPDNGQPTELVRGKVVPTNIPAPQHGYHCNLISHRLSSFVEENDLGRVMCNDAGVIVQRGPDTVRGPDVSYFSFNRLPRGPLPRGYLNVVPELVFEVRSPSDRWSEITAKVGEYLRAGITVACVLDPDARTLTVFRDDAAPVVLNAADELTLPDVLGDAFRVPVHRFLD